MLAYKGRSPKSSPPPTTTKAQEGTRKANKVDLATRSSQSHSTTPTTATFPSTSPVPPMASDRQAPHAEPRRGSTWSLWPLKASNVSSSSSSSSSPSTSFQQQQQQQQQQYSQQYHNALPHAHPLMTLPVDIRSFGSPPSPFGTGQSDSSPPSTPPDVEVRTDLGSSASLMKSPSSRNDIFSAPSPPMAPASRRLVSSSSVSRNASPSLVMPMKGSNRATPSRNSSFFDGGSPSPSPASTASKIPPSAQMQSLPSTPLAYGGASPALADEVDKRLAYGRSNDEERELERARIRQSNSEIDYRLCPAKAYLLGEGRHCNVYLGSYRIKRQGDWQLCAVKRLHSDRQSQLLGLDEVFALRRLGSHPHIIGLVAVRDEVELAAPVASAIASSSNSKNTNNYDENSSSSSRQAASAADSADTRSTKDKATHLGKGLPGSIAASNHMRSSSDTQSHIDLASPAIVTALSLREREDLVSHRRLASQPQGERASQRATLQTPLVLIDSPDGNETQSFSEIHADLRPSDKNDDIPRLLILLELLPYSLSSFAKKNPQVIDWIQWKKWAIQLSQTVAWLHTKGCLHADLKPENILLTPDLDVKLCDFNSALFPNPAIPLKDGLGLGTPAFSAPELMHGAANREMGFDYGIDVWSLGAILYTLATGREAFAKARSMIDLLHRKRRFFESEESDRMARQSVAEGWGNVSSNAGSQPVSRSGSLRKMNHSARRLGSGGSEEDLLYQRVTSPALRREPSSESITSVTSNLIRSSSAGQQTIDTLLDPSAPVGLLVLPGVTKKERSTLSGSNTHNLGHHRASSLGKSHASMLQPHAARSLRCPPVSRPTVLRRTTSYGGAESEESSSSEVLSPTQQQQQQGGQQQQEHTQHHLLHKQQTLQDDEIHRFSGHRRERSEDSITSSACTSPVASPQTSTGLRLAVTQALAATHQHQQQAENRLKAQQVEGEGEEEEEEEEDFTPYQDGSPALILPGGGRLPDAARDLLERMLSTDPRRRPSAEECHLLLLRINL